MPGGVPDFPVSGHFEVPLRSSCPQQWQPLPRDLSGVPEVSLVLWGKAVVPGYPPKGVWFAHPSWGDSRVNSGKSSERHLRRQLCLLDALWT